MQCLKISACMSKPDTRPKETLIQSFTLSGWIEQEGN